MMDCMVNSGPNIYIIDRTKRLVVFADAIISDVVLDARNVGDDFLIFFLSRSLVQSVRTFNVRFHYRSSTVFWNFLLSTFRTWRVGKIWNVISVVRFIQYHPKR